MMFEHFTRPVRAAIIEAQEQARGLGGTQIRPEHVLVGLLSDPHTPAGAVLRELGVQREAVLRQLGPLGDDDAAALRSIGIDLGAIRARVEAAFGPGALDRPAPRGRRPFRRPAAMGGHLRPSDGVKQALEHSLSQARARNSGAITTEHLLLGLLARDGDQAAAALQRLGIPPARVRARVREALDAAA